MAPYTYTTRYQECSRDSYNNNCDADCCVTYFGGISAAFQKCSPALEEDVQCQDSFEAIEATADTCATDGAGNTCATSCCLTIGSDVTCTEQAYCNGYNLEAYSRENIINYGKSFGVSLSPVTNMENSSSAIGGIITFGIAIFILLVVIVAVLCQLVKMKSQNKLISYHSQSNIKLNQNQEKTFSNHEKP